MKKRTLLKSLFVCISFLASSAAFSKAPTLDPSKEKVIISFKGKTKNDWLFILAHDDDFVKAGGKILKQDKEGNVKLISDMLTLMPVMAMNIKRYHEREIIVELIKTSQKGLESPILLRFTKEEWVDKLDRNGVGFQATRFLPYKPGDKIVQSVAVDSNIEYPDIIVHRFPYCQRGEKTRNIYIIFSKSFDVLDESKLSNHFTKPDKIKERYNKYHNKTPDKQVKKDREEAEK